MGSSVLVALLTLTFTKSLGVSANNTSAKWVSRTAINYDDLLPASISSSTNTNYYIGRFVGYGGGLPGPVIRGSIYYSNNDRIETRTAEFEVLVYPCKDFTWVKLSTGQSSWPDNIFIVGNDPKSNEVLFMCRALHTYPPNRANLLGKVVKNEKSCRIVSNLDMTEYKYTEFEALAYTPTQAVSTGGQSSGSVEEDKSIGYLIGLIVCAVFIPIIGIIAFFVGRKCCRKFEFDPMSTAYKANGAS